MINREVKQSRECSQRFHFNDSEVKQHSGGKNNFHAMGLCCATVCRGGGELKLKDAVNREQKKRVADVIKGKEIPIYSYESSINALSKVKFKRFGDLFLPCSNASLAAKLDLMFHFSRFFNDEQPSWSGYMSIHCHGSHNGKSTISFLPIINLKPTDLSCIYSSLKFIPEQSNSIGMETAVVTFD